MKKILSLLLATLFVFMTFALTACTINKDSEVAILWEGDGKATNPNSLINSMERAMYIEHVNYAHYGANGNPATQIEQAKSALDDGCAALVVELVEHPFSDANAEIIVDAAKEKNVPVIFFNTTVHKEILDSYDKCALVTADLESVADVQGQLIADYVKANFKNLDKNKDGKINYVSTSLITAAVVEKANTVLADEDYEVKNEDREKLNTELVPLGVEISLTEISFDETAAELIITDNDKAAFAIILHLQSKGYNTDKLTTHFVPIFTVDNTVDYKAYVLASRPEIPADLVINENDDKKTVKAKNKEIKKLEELKSYYEANKYLVDLTAVNESDLDEMIYTTLGVIDSGRISGTVIKDNDGISLAVAGIVKNLIKGNDVFKGIESEVKDGEIPATTVNGATVKVRYVPYSA